MQFDELTYQLFAFDVSGTLGYKVLQVSGRMIYLRDSNPILPNAGHTEYPYRLTVHYNSQTMV